MNKILITGAAGFIGSHVSEKIFKEFKKSKLILFDKVTYSANKKYLKNLIKEKRVNFIKNDILNFFFLKKILNNVDLVIHIAAESHVDNSFGDSFLFTKTNTLGTHSLLEACRFNNVKKIIHISTDEVYGESSKVFLNEKSNLRPTNPYSASKAAADMFVEAYRKSYDMDITIVRSNNIYGIRQYPEKLISKTIFNFLKKKKMTIHGNGLTSRYFLSVDDFSKGLIKIIKKGKKNSIYNIGGKTCYKTTYIIRKIASILNVNYHKNIVYVNDRPFNDKVYKIDIKKISKLKWKPLNELSKDLPEICKWYKKNLNIFK